MPTASSSPRQCRLTARRSCPSTSCLNTVASSSTPSPTLLSPPELAARCGFDQHLVTLLYPRGEAGPARCGYSWTSHVASSGAELAVHAWWRYRHTGDADWLRSHAYPLLRGVAEFYRSLVRRGEDGQLHLHGTNAHEDFWGVADSVMDLAARRALQATEIIFATYESSRRRGRVDLPLKQKDSAYLSMLESGEMLPKRARK
jgi:hypothetical protein